MLWGFSVVGSNHDYKLYTKVEVAIKDEQTSLLRLITMVKRFTAAAPQ
jgi:hypothetical protein